MQSEPQMLPASFEGETGLIARPEALLRFQAHQESTQAAQAQKAMIHHQHQQAEKENSNSSGNMGLEADSGSAQKAPKDSSTNKNSNRTFLSRLFCLGGGDMGVDGTVQHASGNFTKYMSTNDSATQAVARANLSSYDESKPKLFFWDGSTEYTIKVCIEHLEKTGAMEPRLFAVSADQDEIDTMRLQVGQPLDPSTDLHLAAALIKDRMRHAESAFLPLEALQHWILDQKRKSENAANKPLVADVNISNMSSKLDQAHEDRSHLFSLSSSDDEDESGDMQGVRMTASFVETPLKKTLDLIRDQISVSRASLFAKFMRLLGNITARQEVTKMNGHNLALCIAPSMMQWDPNPASALLVLNKMTAFVMEMIDNSRIYSESLDRYCDLLLQDD